MNDADLLSNLRNVVVHIDQGGRLLNARGAIDGIAGYSSTELLGMSVFDLVSPVDHELLIHTFSGGTDTRIYDRPLPFPITLLTKTGQPEVCDVLPIDVEDEDGPSWIATITPRRLHSGAFDIAELVLDGAPFADVAEAVASRDVQSHHAGQRMQTTYVIEAIGSLDVRVHAFEGDQGFADALIEEARRDDSSLDEFSDDGAIHSRKCADLSPRLAAEAERCGYQVAHFGVASDGGIGRACVLWMASDDRSFALRPHSEPVRNGLLRLIRSTLTRERAERVLLEQATIDPLTGLGNRRYFQEQVDGVDSEHPIAVLYVDLDEFKAINDSFGHDVGDQVLATVGRRLASACRGDSVVARLGGDEFAVLLPGASADDATIVAERLRRAIAEPLQLAVGALKVTATVGTSSSTGGAALSDLVTSADLAMLERKRDHMRGDDIAILA